MWNIVLRVRMDVEWKPVACGLGYNPDAGRNTSCLPELILKLVRRQRVLRGVPRFVPTTTESHSSREACRVAGFRLMERVEACSSPSSLDTGSNHRIQDHDRRIHLIYNISYSAI